jgi:hypothetical protein
MATPQVHFVIPFVGRTGENGDPWPVAEQLQTVIDHYAQHGWEFYAVEKVGCTINPGCLGALFGHSPAYGNIDLVVFRRAR